jgi:8-oxo-dGTP pyrophosphatase MutT (NUDIX family)
MDESMKDAAKRETLEEAGVTGKVEVSIFKEIMHSICLKILLPTFGSNSTFWM